MTSAWEVAASTPDPELPNLTVADLGILRSVEQTANALVVTITQTWSGCPAMHEIGADLRAAPGGAQPARLCRRNARINPRPALLPINLLNAAGRRRCRSAVNTRNLS